MMTTYRFRAALVAVSLVLSSTIRAGDALPLGLNDGDRVAILGDSITQQRNYSALLEMYFLACQPAAHLDAVQFGWGGETTWGLFPRIDTDVLWYKPTVATIAYGMNDGGYQSVDPKRINDYKTNLTGIVTRLKSAGVQTIVIGGPGAVDTDTYMRNGRGGAKLYNKTLAAFSAAAQEVAQQQGVRFGNLHSIMADAMDSFKQRYPGKSFVGGDGIHPENVGHMVMAYAFLKALGCDGNLGTIHVDLRTHKADATGGHKLVEAKGDSFIFESTRYPFQAKKSGSPTSLWSGMDLVPFQQEFNRFMLTVSGAPAGKRVKLTWSEVLPPGTDEDDLPAVEVSKTLDADKLAKGINLAAEFETTPFERAWGKLDAAVHMQQDIELPLTHHWLHDEKDLSAQLPQAAVQVRGLAESGKQVDANLRAIAAATVRPVRHKLTLEVE